MKRIKAACIKQILCFTPKDGISPGYRDEAVKGECCSINVSWSGIAPSIKFFRKRWAKTALSPWKLLNSTIPRQWAII